MSDPDPRLGPLLEVMLAMARQDFEVKAPIGDRDDVIDAIAIGLNMLSDELRGEVASRGELERAHQELKQTQAQLVHAGKLAAIGQLAAGVAHEINNPIQGIQICLSIVERTQRQLLDALASGTLADLDQATARMQIGARAIADANEAIDRIRGVTTSLRVFARADDEAMSPVQLDEVVRVSCRLSESTARVRARLELDLPEVPLVRGSRGKLGQVVTNLLVNAIQAIPEGAPDRHVIRLALRHSGDAVSLTVDDSGPGVPAAQRQRIFEPFYTTKPPGVGTGLGLALVAEIVRSHEGTTSVGESPLGGARFEVTLPRISRMDPAVPAPPIEPRATRRPRALFVDDEAMLLRLFESLLADDCDVVTAGSGEEALRILRGDLGFDLVVCDLQMPGLDGVGVYEAATALAPELGPRFVFATGGAVTSRGQTFLERGDIRVLQKPFPMSALLELLQGLTQPGESWTLRR